MRTGPLRTAVLQALAELRRAQPKEVAERLGGRYTEKQVGRSLLNAKREGLIESSGVVRIKGYQGSIPATYWLPGDEPPQEIEDEQPLEELFKPNRTYPRRPAYPSVWHYAQGQEVKCEQVRRLAQARSQAEETASRHLPRGLALRRV